MAIFVSVFDVFAGATGDTTVPLGVLLGICALSVGVAATARKSRG